MKKDTSTKMMTTKEMSTQRITPLLYVRISSMNKSYQIFQRFNSESHPKEVVTALKQGQISSADLVLEYLDRIDANNHKGLHLNAVIETAPREKLLAVAARLDAERVSGNVRGELHGVPILIKDSIATSSALGMQTTIGLKALAEDIVGSVVPGNAEIVDQLISAGAIILGTANLTILGNAYGQDTPSGWSQTGGQTGSIFGAINPQGSSTGSAVGLAAGFCAFSIGTEHNGSTINPARKAALFALKASAGLVSYKGALGLSPACDAIGLMGKCTWDIAAALQSIYNGPQNNFLPKLEAIQGIESFQIGLAQFTKASWGNTPLEEAQASWDMTMKFLEPAVKVKHIEIPGAEEISRKEDFGDGIKYTGRSTYLYLVDMYKEINTYLSSLGNCSVNNLEELIAWNKAHPKEAFPIPAYQDQLQLEQALILGGKQTKEYKDIVNMCEQVVEEFHTMLDKHHLQAIAYIFGLDLEPTLCYVASMGGLPIASIPAGITHRGEPYSLCFVAKKGQEETLIQLTAACEAILPARTLPTVL